VQSDSNDEHCIKAKFTQVRIRFECEWWKWKALIERVIPQNFNGWGNANLFQLRTVCDADPWISASLETDSNVHDESEKQSEKQLEQSTSTDKGIESSQVTNNLKRQILQFVEAENMSQNSIPRGAYNPQNMICR
jgi:hypothetical protein